jgi:ankyrin repeat-rich membrane spanning protein
MFLFIGRLNTNEDNENMLGYDLYSSALADILSEPSLSMPITVGLYAKWGSGKSFLLNKLRGAYANGGMSCFQCDN